MNNLLNNCRPLNRWQTHRYDREWKTIFHGFVTFERPNYHTLRLWLNLAPKFMTSYFKAAEHSVLCTRPSVVNAEFRIRGMRPSRCCSRFIRDWTRQTRRSPPSKQPCQSGNETRCSTPARPTALLGNILQFCYIIIISWFTCLVQSKSVKTWGHQ